MTNRLSNAETVDVWKTMVGVQLHFSQMEMTTRNIFVTIVIALIAGVGFSIKEGITLVVGAPIPAAALLGLIGIFVTWLFYFVDRYWYHRFLVGTGDAAGPLEKYLSNISPAPIELGAKIGARSPLTVGLWKPLRWLTWFLASDDPRDIGGRPGSSYIQAGRLHSEAKISVFYKSVMLLFLIMAILSYAATPVSKPSADPQKEAMIHPTKGKPAVGKEASKHKAN